MIGRVKEQRVLQDAMESNRAEFLVIYGRRRVGKTYLVKEFFNERFSFYATGVNNVNMTEQLGYFHDSLVEYGDDNIKKPKNWREAFQSLKKLLLKDSITRDPATRKRLIFLDELPWMDTPKSGFRPALDHFWNSWASTQKDIVLIVCGSATSWIINNILSDKGGFYNRITRQIHLMPFTLKECRLLFMSNDIRISQDEMIQSYMVFGGIPHYLNLFSRRLSLAQNIDALIFDETGQLHYEYQHLFQSLFRNPEKHYKIVRALTGRRIGLTRREVIAKTRIADGELLTKALDELCQCGFIRKYKNYYKETRDAYFQIIDPFVLFCHAFLEEEKANSWIKYIRTPGYHSWCGLAFEMVCLNHVPEIKAALGISGVETHEYAWRSESSSPGAEIDLLIDRADQVINVCEMKYSSKEYVIDAAYVNDLENKLEVFQKETKSKKALHLTMVTANGLKKNSHSGIVVCEIDGNILFGEH